MDVPIKYLQKSIANVGQCIYSWFLSMHTRVDVVLIDKKHDDKQCLPGVVEEIYHELCKLESIGNCFDCYSELSKVNRCANIEPVYVSDTLYDILSECKRYNADTMGYFDVTVDSKSYRNDMMRSVLLSSEKHTVFYQSDDIYINLSGFLKGYALDRIREIIKSRDIDDALINMGNSSVMALGNSPSADGWNVSYGTFISNSRGTNNSVVLHDQCLTTSGNGDYKKGHIYNPIDGAYMNDKLATSVITQTGALGEVLSTVLFVIDNKNANTLKAKFSYELVINS